MDKVLRTTLGKLPILVLVPCAWLAYKERRAALDLSTQFLLTSDNTKEGLMH